METISYQHGIEATVLVFILHSILALMIVLPTVRYSLKQMRLEGLIPEGTRFRNGFKMVTMSLLISIAIGCISAILKVAFGENGANVVLIIYLLLAYGLSAIHSYIVRKDESDTIHKKLRRLAYYVIFFTIFAIYFIACDGSEEGLYILQILFIGGGLGICGLIKSGISGIAIAIFGVIFFLVGFIGTII